MMLWLQDRERKGLSTTTSMVVGKWRAIHWTKKAPSEEEMEGFKEKNGIWGDEDDWNLRVGWDYQRRR